MSKAPKVAPKVVMIKLAAIGDVTIACRAVIDLLQAREGQLVLHWFIDKNLAALAQALLKTSPVAESVEIVCHEVDSTQLFQGSLLAKAAAAARMAAKAALIMPSRVALLHRDWRYTALLTPLFGQRLFSIRRGRKNELSTYAECLTRMADSLRMPLKNNMDTTSPRTASTGRIGILVGGAKNQKLTYREKRWPHLAQLVDLLLKDERLEVVLYGSPEDMPAAQELIARHPRSTRLTSLVGTLKLAELPASLATLDGFVSIDSGLAHIAATVMRAPHQKVVTLFGPTDPVVWSPVVAGDGSVKVLYKTKECSPCYHDDGNFKPCLFTGDRFQHCMTDISPSDVVRALTCDDA